MQFIEVTRLEPLYGKPQGPLLINPAQCIYAEPYRSLGIEGTHVRLAHHTGPVWVQESYATVRALLRDAADRDTPPAPSPREVP
jgi:hypothetical protein